MWRNSWNKRGKQNTWKNGEKKMQRKRCCLLLVRYSVTSAATVREHGAWNKVTRRSGEPKQGIYSHHGESHIARGVDIINNSGLRIRNWEHFKYTETDGIHLEPNELNGEHLEQIELRTGTHTTHGTESDSHQPISILSDLVFLIDCPLCWDNQVKAR